ncbi:MAG: hypothetical protein HYX22_00855 [Candidatus Yanofskybacteria bacterium]|nr:hypothetical protein [Candidatus Yanofskybacteria bacterium]
MSKNLLIIVVAVVVAIIALVLVFFNPLKTQRSATVTSTPAPENVSKSLGEEISGQIQNPAEKLPESNPFQESANPFEETNTNPFRDTFTNPFE